jgi:Uma2 family endonuclease
MGHANSRESLILRWTGLCDDPSWKDWPGKIELNGLGVIEMSPASNRHGRLQALIAAAMEAQLKGAAFVECSVLTDDGVRVPDVAWASPGFMARHGMVTPFPLAPEICIEVRSPTNTDAEMAFKVDLFLRAGAEEAWVVDADGTVHVFDANGARAASRFGVTLDLGMPP